MANQWNNSSILFTTLLTSTTLYAQTLKQLDTLKPSQLPKALVSFNQTKQTIALKKMIANTDLTGHQHIRYQQLIAGAPVWGYQVINHQQTSLTPWTGTWVSATSSFIQHKPTSLSHDNKLVTSLNNSLLKNYNLQTNSQSNTPNFSLVVFIDKQQQLHWAYLNETKRYSPKPVRIISILDAENHTLLHQSNILATANGTGPGGNEKMGVYEYGTEQPNLNVTQTTDDCLMENELVTTVNLNNEWGSSNKPYHFPCFRSHADSANGAASPINDAHAFASIIFNMYQTWYHLSPINGRLIMRTHFAEDFENAFWDGEAMTFGDGDNESYTLVSLDIAAHEISHGFTEKHSNLNIEGEPGAINEAFSDMASKTTEFFARGSNTWGFGQDVSRKTEAFRYLDNPTKDGESIDNINDYHNQDVHLACGIYNKVFYLLATYPKQTATEFTWNIHKAFDVFEHANANYWQPNTGFSSGAQDLIRSTQDLGYPTDALQWALGEVGLQKN